jgi:hypothetical protein
MDTEVTDLAISRKVKFYRNILCVCSDQELERVGSPRTTF